MASGTKILLAVLAVIAIGVFVYYATIPQGDGTSDADAPDAKPAETTSEQIPGQDSAQTGDESLMRGEPSVPESRSPSFILPPQEDAPIASNQPPLANLPAGNGEGGLGDAVRRALSEDDSPAAEETGPTIAPDAASGTQPADSQTGEADATSAVPPVTADAGDATAGSAAQPPPASEGNPPASSEGDKPPATPPAEPAATKYTEYTVKSGETLTSIAGDWFGDPNKWDLIHKANPQIDKDKLDIGQKLRLPPKNATREGIRPPRTGGVNVHVVGSGDTLSSIARAYYGDPNKWRIIYDANRAAIGADPDDLTVGTKLTIPPKPAEAE